MSKRECIVMEPLASIFRVSRIYGITPLSLIPLNQSNSRRNPPNAYRASASRKICVCSCVVFVIYIMTDVARIMYYKTYEMLLHHQSLKSFIWSSVHFFQIFCISIIIILATFGGHTRMKRVVEYLYTLERLNLEMGNNYANIKIKYSKAIAWSFLVGIYFIGVTYVSLPFILNYSKPMYLALGYAFHFNSRVYIVLLQLQFVFFVYLVNETVHVLQERLQSLILKPEIYTSVGNGNNSARIKIRNFSYIYKSLCILVEKIDEEEGTINFLIFFFKIVDIMDAIYVLAMTPGNTILGIITLIYTGATFILMIEPCHQTVNKFQMIRVSVSHLICLSTKGDVREELYSFSCLLMQNVPKFSPLGILSFTRSLLLAIAGALVSYLVAIL